MANIYVGQYIKSSNKIMMTNELLFKQLPSTVDIAIIND